MKSFTFTLTIYVLALSGCVSTAQPQLDGPPQQAGVAARLLENGGGLLARGDTAAARELLQEAAAQDLTDPTRQTLLGLSYHVEAAKGTDSLRLARVGYETALKSAPADYWAGILAGRAAFELGDYRGASERFARVCMNHPSRAEPFAALAAAAYQGGDLSLALLAAERAEALVRKETTATEPLPAGSAGAAAGLSQDRILVSALRITTLAHAAQGDRHEMQQAMLRLAQVDSQVASQLETRTEQLIRTAAIDEESETTSEDSHSTEVDPDLAEVSAGNEQISVDVVILLAQHKRTDSIGMNLLDGLQLQFGGRRETRDVRNDDGSTFERTITRAITLPDLTYNLNIFNRQGASYEVAARPTLTAYLGEQSEFFVGKSLRIAVKGINDSTLETVDVGINLKAKPIEIDDSGAKLNIAAERSFLQEGGIGSFAEGLSTFRQFVSATARVKFGETLVLSGLSESASDSTGSQTPILGDLPLIGRAFNQRTTDQRRDSVMILVTPSRPTQFASEPWARREAVQKMIDMWSKVIDPATNAGSVTARLSRTRTYSRMQQGDASMAFPSGAEDLKSLVKAILNL